jgi:archaeal flagellin FlaB
MDFTKPKDEAFTGLEAAIVLIAFVVVAAVFAYVILGAGFLTTQKSQETVHTGISQATSAVQQSGQTSIQANTAGDGVSQISFFLQPAASGTGADMGTVGYTVSTSKKMTTFSSNEVTYTWVKEVAGSGGNHGAHSGVLNPKEMVLVTIPISFTATEMGLSDKFTVEVKPGLGSPVTIVGTVPGAMNANNWYDVY